MVITASAQTSVTVDGIKYNLDGSTATVTYPNDSRPGSSNPSTYTGDITIPSTITVDEVTYNVTEIGERAFYAANISSISLPDGLLTIGKKSLMSSGIAELNVPSSVTKLGDEAVEGCSNLTTITLNEGSGGTWGRWVFWRASDAYDVYMICDTKPEVPDIYTFDNDFASTIHIYPSLYLDYKTDYHWNCYNIVPDLVQDMSHEDLQTAIANFSAKLPANDEVGTAPGFYSQSSVDAVKDALAAAAALDEGPTGGAFYWPRTIPPSQIAIKAECQAIKD